MKSKIFSLLSLSILSLVMVMSLASAVGLSFVNVDTNPIEVDHNSQATITFELENSGAYDISDISLIFPELTDVGIIPSSAWSSMSTGDLIVLEGENSAVLTTTLSIPKNTAPGTYTGDFGGTCEYSTSLGTTRYINTYTYTITITSTPSLSVSDVEILPGDTTAIVKIKNTGNVELTGIDVTADVGDFSVTMIDPSTIPTLAPNGEIDVTINFDSEELDSLDEGTYTVTIDATASDEPTNTGTVSYTKELGLSLSFSPTEMSYVESAITTLTIENTGNADLTGITLIQSGDFIFDLSEVTSFDLPAGGIPKVLDLTMTTSLNDLNIGTNKVTITATADDTTTSQKTITIIKPFYEGENQGDLEVRSIDFSVEEGFGDDEKYWYLLDEIEVTADIKNYGEWDIENIEISACLLDTDTGNCIIDEGDMDLSEDDFDLDSKEDTEITLTFKLDPDDFDAGNDDYEFYVSAIGKIDDSESDYDEDETGHSKSKEIKIRTSEEFIIIDDIEFNGLNEDMILSEIISCGSEIQITADVWNVGDKKIKEEDVHIWIYNKALGIDEVITDLNDISALDKETLTFTFNVPEDVEEKTYYISFRVYDDEDRADNDIYENSEDDESEFSVLMKVEGSCATEAKAMVTATLESGGQTGEELIIKATIVNTGDESSTYLLNAAGYAEWASSVEVSQSEVVLDAGESKEVLFTFNVKKDALEGDSLFNIEVISGSDLVTSQPVSVTIETSSSLGKLSSLTGNMISKDNWHLWGIGFLNVILVLTIIFIGIRIAKK